MFILSKLISATLGTLIAGSCGGIAIPSVRKHLNFFFQESPFQKSINLEELEKTEQEISDKLKTSKTQYGIATKGLEYLKKFNLHQISEKFNEIFKTEISLKEKYREVLEKIKELTHLTEKEGTTKKDKLENQKELNLSKTYSQTLNALSSRLYGGEKEINKIICAIEGEQGEKNNCSSRTGFRSILDLISLGSEGEVPSQPTTHIISAEAGGGHSRHW